MLISLSAAKATSTKAHHLVVGVFQALQPPGKAKKTSTSAAKKGASKAKSAPAKGQKGMDVSPLLQEVDDATNHILLEAARAEGFKADAGASFSLHTHGKLGVRTLTLIGLGAAEDSSVDLFRRLGGLAARAAMAKRSAKLAVVCPEQDDHGGAAEISALTEGAMMATYRFDRYLQPNKDEVRITHLELLTSQAKNAKSKAAIARGKSIAEGVHLARDLVNECPGTLNPVQFAKEARIVGKAAGLSVTVMGEKELEKERMGMMLAVAQAAAPYVAPRLVKLAYKPKKKAKRHIVLVGKGLTFDSGGLDLKPAAGMLEMKIDMGGAAAVLGAMLAVGKVQPDVEVTAYLGCVENGIGGNAYHPGDVLTSRKGLTVEVNNTDAEGRLVLGDCIDYALTKDKPDILVDLATLTGACMVALGPTTAGLFTDDDELAADLLNAGDRSGEDFWRLPLNRALEGQLKSSIADTKNTGERMGGAITAGLFLNKFVDGRARWAHLDIAGPTTNEKEHPYLSRGGAGFAVRTLVSWISPI